VFARRWTLGKQPLAARESHTVLACKVGKTGTPRTVQKLDRRAKRGIFHEGFDSIWLPQRPLNPPSSGRLAAMPSLSHPLQFVLVALAGWINQQQRRPPQPKTLLNPNQPITAGRPVHHRPSEPAAWTNGSPPKWTNLKPALTVAGTCRFMPKALISSGLPFICLVPRPRAHTCPF
jgi:hypothetical protein